MVTTSMWITVDQIFNKKSSNVPEISFRCSDCSDRDEIQIKRLLTFQQISCLKYYQDRNLKSMLLVL